MKFYEIFENGNQSHSAGTFGCLKLCQDHAHEIAEWCRNQGIECQDPDELHCTVMFSERPCPELAKFHDMPCQIPAQVTGYKLMGPALALTLQCSGAHEIHKRIMQHSNASYKWPSYIPHMSLNYSQPTETPGKLPRNTLLFDRMHVTPLDPNFAK